MPGGACADLPQPGRGGPALTGGPSLLPTRASVAPLQALAGGPRYQRRLAPRCTDLMYICDGDRNGVLHHIGTDYGRKVGCLGGGGCTMHH